MFYESILLRNKSLRKIVLIAFVLFFLNIVFTPKLFADDDVDVKKIIAETEDSIRFQISVDRNEIKRGEDIVINYEIKNNGKNKIYLITDPKNSKVEVSDLWILNVPVSALTFPDPHYPYNYQFTKIPSGKTLKGKFIIEADVYISDKKYAFENAAIKAYFSYLFDISGLEDCEGRDYTLPCLDEVYNRAKSLEIGNLVLQIEEKENK